MYFGLIVIICSTNQSKKAYHNNIVLRSTVAVGIHARTILLFDRNSSGQVPYVATKDRQVRNEFRKFRAQFPERYDYEAAGVPAPLSEERETEKRAKEVERRKAMKKAKAARLKVGAV